MLRGEPHKFRAIEMATLSFPVRPAPSPGIIPGRPAAKYSGARLTTGLVAFSRDFRMQGPTDGIIRDRVVHKSSPTAPEVPYTDSRIYVMRLTDFYRAWTGLTDALGYYTATGLEPGVAYVPVAVDLAGTEKCTAGGPVVAKKA